MRTHRRLDHVRAFSLFLTGVLPMAIQPSALAGQIAVSRQVDRMVAELQGMSTVDDLVRLLDESTSRDAESSGGETSRGDVAAVIVYCKLFSLISDSAVIPGRDIDVDLSTPGVVPGEPIDSGHHSRLNGLVSVAVVNAISTRKLSDEQPLGP